MLRKLFTAALASVSLAAALEVPPAVKDKVQDRFVPVPFERQKIEGWIGARLDVNRSARLLQVDTGPLLAGYRQRPGKQTWIGEHLAKFIDAGVNAWAVSGDAKLKSAIDNAVLELIATQMPDGYLGTYLPEQRWRDWDVWAHKYNLIALLNYYRHTAYSPALDASRKMGDLLVKTFGEGEGQRNIVVGDWHRGMASSSVLEPVVMLYRYTGEPRYLEFARYIVRAWESPQGPKILSTLRSTGSVQKVANNKAYEMMSNFVGLADLYRVTGDRELLEGVETAWKDIVSNRLYVTGTTSWDEHFREDHVLRADNKDKEAGVGEGCVTVTWMQLNWHLLRLTGEAKYAEELERTFYNALAGSQHPVKGTVCYFTALNGRKEYGEVSQGVPGVSCCTSSVPRGVALVPAAIWGGLEKGIAVNLYTAGSARIDTPGGPVTIAAKTEFPSDGSVVLEVAPERPAQFPVFLRVPRWATSFSARLKGRSYQGVAGSYLVIDGPWPGRVEISMDVTPRIIDAGPSYPGRVGIARGPQVLAADNAFHPDVDLWLANIRLPLKAEQFAGSYPRDWNGRGAFAVDGYTGNSALPHRQRTLVFVPLSEAGQRGSEYRVWVAAERK